MKLSNCFIGIGLSGEMFKLSNIDWGALDHITGSVLHIVSIISIGIGLFMKRKDIKKEIVKRFKLKK